MELNDLLKEQENPNFYENLERSTKINKRIKHLENILAKINKLKQKIDECEEFINYIESSDDDSLLKETLNLLNELSKETEDLYLETLLNGKYDSCNAFLKIHSGAGGTEACDWAQMLSRMYLMFCEKMGYKASITDYVDGDGAGYKSVTIYIEGENAYGYLKGEMGVHRLVRISPFDANKRRHTSFASVEVMPEVEDDSEVVINPNDIRIDTFRSSGAGGQHINKTESAIRITHFPTGIVVTCQDERSQIKNRETAFKILRSNLAIIKEQEKLQEAKNLKGDTKKIEWGSQIRSYVFCPYNLVSDNRTKLETSNLDAVMNGDIKDFLIEYLKMNGEK